MGSYGYRRRSVPRWSELSHPQRIVALAVMAFAVSLFAWLGWGLFGVEHQTGKVVVCRWAWHIDVQKWDKRHYERVSYRHPSSCPDESFCGGVYNFRSWTEARTTTSTDSKGNTSIHVHVDTYHAYDHDEWVPHRTFSVTGTDRSPHPPTDFVLERPTTDARTQHQCQVGEIRRPYTVLVECQDGKGRTWTTLDFNEWAAWNPGDRVDVNLTGFGEVRTIAPLRVEANE